MTVNPAVIMDKNNASNLHQGSELVLASQDQERNDLQVQLLILARCLLKKRKKRGKHQGGELLQKSGKESVIIRLAIHFL